MRQRFAKWMMGRNGMDALNRLLSVLTLILLCVSMFVHGYASRILWSLAVLGLIVTYFRMFSRNVYRRQQENAPDGRPSSGGQERVARRGRPLASAARLPLL